MVDAGYTEWVQWGAIFFIGAAAALWIDYLLRPHSAFKATVKRIHKRIEGKHYKNTKVNLDGHSYTKCVFENVTFVYDGGAFELVGNKIDGCMVATNVSELEKFTRLLGELHFLSVPIHGDQGPLTLSGAKRVGSGDPDVTGPDRS